MTNKKQSVLMLSKPRMFIICSVVFVLFSAIIVRLFYLHVILSDSTAEEADKARLRRDFIKAKRGNITDSKGNILATSSPVITIGVDPETFKHRVGKDNELPLKKILKMSVEDMKAYQPKEETIEGLKKIAKLLNMSYDELYKKCTTSGTSWRKLAVITDEEIYKQIKECDIQSIYGTYKYVRKYPSGPVSSHVVGFITKNNDKMGIEKAFDHYLEGQDGYIETERDGRRSELPQFRTRIIEPRNGDNIELAIDLTIQGIVQEQLSKIKEAYNPERATIIVSEPSTGYVLAMASYPNFDPNDYGKYTKKEYTNYAVSEIYEPGSTFKIVTVAAALNEAVVDLKDTFDCSSKTINYAGKQLKLPREDHAMKEISLRDIIIKSSNRGAAMVGVKLGADLLIKYAQDFGFGSKTGIRLHEEVSGIVNPKEKWRSPINITRIPMGHAIASTPLQTHCSMCVIANGGAYMKPILVKRIFDDQGNTIQNYSPEPPRPVISPKVASLMTDMLVDVTTKGTGKRAAMKGFKVAGKTGTTQKLKNFPVKKRDGSIVYKQKYSDKHHVASFTGFFPASRPRVVITVVVDEARLGEGKRAYGSVVAVPAFKEIAEKVAKYLGIQPDEDFEKSVAWKVTRYESL